MEVTETYLHETTLATTQNEIKANILLTHINITVNMKI